MEDFTKVTNPRKSTFCKIKFAGGELSITGVSGPLSNGDCTGSCGQITNELASDKLALTEDWSSETLGQFIATWKRWHLNHMRAACQHQRESGYLDLASQGVLGYGFALSAATLDAKNDAEQAALKALKDGVSFTPTDEQVRLTNLDYSKVIWVRNGCEVPDAPQGYEQVKVDSTYPRYLERKTLGSLSQKEHHEGLLNRPCPTCGYKYGSAWLREEVPADVLEFLKGLPDTRIQPAWV